MSTKPDPNCDKCRILRILLKDYKFLYEQRIQEVGMLRNIIDTISEESEEHY